MLLVKPPCERGGFSLSSVFKGFGSLVVIQPLVSWLINQCLRAFAVILQGTFRTGYITKTATVI